MWQIEISSKITKKFLKIDKPIRADILKYLKEIQSLPDPRTRGKGLTGNLSGAWRWRVGDYRITAAIMPATKTITVLDIEHRSKIYRH